MKLPRNYLGEPFKREMRTPASDLLRREVQSRRNFLGNSMMMGGAASGGWNANLIPYAGLFAGSTGYLSRTVTTSATTSGSVWVKRGKLGAVQSIFDNKVYFNASDQLVAFGLTSTAVFRDPTAWYHIFWNGSGVWVNGVSVSGTGTYTPAAVTNPRLGYDGTNYFDGMMCQWAFWDGSSAALADGGGKFHATETTKWVPKAPTGMTDLVPDPSAGTATTGTNWIKTGTITQVTDTPSNNYATLNPAGNHYPTEVGTKTNGNLSFTYSGGNYAQEQATIPLPTTGKWAVKLTRTSASGIIYVGLSTLHSPVGLNNYVGARSDSYGFNQYGRKVNSGSQSAYGSAWNNGAQIELLYNADTREFRVYVAGADQGVAYTVPAGQYVFAVSAAKGGAVTLDFGQTGYVPTDTTYETLCTANLPTPTYKDFTEYYHQEVVVHDGTASTITLNGKWNALTTDWMVQVKNVSTGAWYRINTKSGLDKYVQPSSTAGEQTDANLIINRTATGFQLGSGFTAGSYLVEVWREAAGWFYIAQYTGDGNAATTIAHGLGAVPAKIDVKALVGTNSNNNWYIYHKSLAANTNLTYTTAAAAGTGTYTSGIINTSPTSTYFGFTAGSSVVNVNENGTTFVSFLWAENDCQKFGSIVGNSSSDGTLYNVGVKPVYFQSKPNASGQSWLMRHACRDSINPTKKDLFLNNTAAEYDWGGTSTGHLDFVSCGAKPRGTLGEFNGSYTILYHIIGQPFGGAKVPPATAR